MAKLTKREIAAFRRHVDGLNRLIEQVRTRIPDARYYMEGESGLHLMSGPSHEDGVSRHDRILCGAQLEHSDCGAW